MFDYLYEIFKTETLSFYLFYFILFFIQTKGVLFVKGQLYFSVLSAEVKPLPPERAGPE